MSARLARVPYSVGEWRGHRFGELPPGLERALPGWLEARDVPEGADLKDGRVFRAGELVVKFARPPRRLRDRFRPTPTSRAAELAVAIAPIRAPRPWVALERGGRLGLREGVAVTEFVDGRFLGDLWGEDEEAELAYADFLASLVRRRVFHGDFHLQNVLWDASGWCLIDLEGIRHPGRTLRWRRLVDEPWAKTWIGLGRPDRLRERYERFHAAAGRLGSAGDAWGRIVRLGDAIARRFGDAGERAAGQGRSIG